jgi:GT2 family glycosyltransferase
MFVEVLVVDDGELSAAVVERVRNSVERWGGRFRYGRTSRPGGLFAARLIAIQQASGSVVLFLDDDVEVARGYLERLVARYLALPAAAGVGGVPVPNRRSRLLRRLFARLFLLDSGHPGRLSASGFNYSITQWEDVGELFRSEFLSGCNMSFRREALAGVEPVAWLQHYIQGDDLYLALRARAAGELWVDPALRVLHHVSPTSRTSAADAAPSVIYNLFQLLRLQDPRWWNYLAFHWTTFGLTLMALLRPGRQTVALGYLRGLYAAVRDVSSGRSS